MDQHRNKKVVSWYTKGDFLLFHLVDSTVLTFVRATDLYPDIVAGGLGWTFSSTVHLI